MLLVPLEQVAEFREQIQFETDLFDPEGVHHEFVGGTHGQKLDMDAIVQESALYADWVDLSKTALRNRVTELGDLEVLAVVGVANGTNRLARSVGTEMNKPFLITQKTSPKVVELTEESREKLKGLVGGGGKIWALEDVGTTGGTALTALNSVREVGDFAVGCQVAWQRTERLTALEEARIGYYALIKEVLPTYTPEQCRQIGFCAQGWELIPHH